MLGYRQSIDSSSFLDPGDIELGATDEDLSESLRTLRRRSSVGLDFIGRPSSRYVSSFNIKQEIEQNCYHLALTGCRTLMNFLMIVNRKSSITGLYNPRLSRNSVGGEPTPDVR
jgi:hypothetical protein